MRQSTTPTACEKPRASSIFASAARSSCRVSSRSFDRWASEAARDSSCHLMRDAIKGHQAQSRAARDSSCHLMRDAIKGHQAPQSRVIKRNQGSERFQSHLASSSARRLASS
jgi:hypothetical protein